MKLYEIVKQKNEAIRTLDDMKADFAKNERDIIRRIEELTRLESLAVGDNDIEKIQIAETVLRVRGALKNIVSWADGEKETIAEKAIRDIANGCGHLKTKFYGNKSYASFFQGSDHPYGYGPKHGGIVGAIELSDDAQKRDLTEAEKDACIYYLSNLVRIKNALPVGK